jgi:hypothetical protein
MGYGFRVGRSGCDKRAGPHGECPIKDEGIRIRTERVCVLHASFFCSRMEPGMANSEVIKLTWGGRETAASTIEALLRHAKVEIALPASMHHALFRRLYPDADVADTEEVDVVGGAELIASLATLDGLQALAELDEPLSRSGYRLHLRSPSPVLSLLPPETP